jgi:hypothetical protein
MIAVRTLNIIAVSLICFLLAVPHAAFAQALDEANVLNQQVIRLNDQGFYLGRKTASLFAVGPTQAQTCRLRRDIVLKLHWS